MDEKLQNWVEGLSREQADALLVELLGEVIDADIVHFGGCAPYWEATGELLVPGQKVWSDEG